MGLHPTVAGRRESHNRRGPRRSSVPWRATSPPYAVSMPVGSGRGVGTSTSQWAWLHRDMSGCREPASTVWTSMVTSTVSPACGSPTCMCWPPIMIAPRTDARRLTAMGSGSGAVLPFRDVPRAAGHGLVRESGRQLSPPGTPRLARGRVPYAPYPDAGPVKNAPARAPQQTGRDLSGGSASGRH